MDIYHNFAKIVNLQSLVRLQCQTCIELSMMDAIGPSFQGFPFVGDFGNIGCCWGYYCNPITANTTAFWLTMKDIISTVRHSKHTPIRRYPIHWIPPSQDSVFFIVFKVMSWSNFNFQVCLVFILSISSLIIYFIDASRLPNCWNETDINDILLTCLVNIVHLQMIQ